MDVGKGIMRFKQGDLVIAPFSLSCGASPDCSSVDQIADLVQVNATIATWDSRHDATSPSHSAVEGPKELKPNTSGYHSPTRRYSTLRRIARSLRT